jgi:hypothetical protein
MGNENLLKMPRRRGKVAKNPYFSPNMGHLSVFLDEKSLLA